ncbi:MAG: hypothetical protein Q8L14_28855 [Myxococcales bacterium]|nr:hypothetical protein [Myxococcales bacterium]
MTAACATHEGADAVITCKRCGGFMCEACTLHRTEDRCITCRPRRTREERDERRRNAVKRSAWMECEACGYLGPRFERAALPSLGELVILAAMLVTVGFASVAVGTGLAVVFALVAFRSSRHLSCPRCGTTDALWPATEQAGLPIDPAFVAATSANDAALRRQRRTRLFVVALAAVLGALMFFARAGWLQTAG